AWPRAGRDSARAVRHRDDAGDGGRPAGRADGASPRQAGVGRDAVAGILPAPGRHVSRRLPRRRAGRVRRRRAARRGGRRAATDVRRPRPPRQGPRADAARELGYTTLRLETGNEAPEARALYTSSGYGPIPCWGPFATDPKSRCFE